MDGLVATPTAANADGNTFPNANNAISIADEQPESSPFAAGTLVTQAYQGYFAADGGSTTKGSNATLMAEGAASRPHGVGTLWRGEEACYRGDFANGQRHGQGSVAFANGEEYFGGWADNKFHGVGVYRCNDGTAVEAEWAAGRVKRLRYHGEVSPDGYERHGTGVAAYSDGTRYNGEWVRNARHGTGLVQYSNGTIYSGQFAHDNQHGWGKIVNSDSVFMGEFREGAKHGVGVLVVGRKTLQGRWTDDVLGGWVRIWNDEAGEVIDTLYADDEERTDVFVMSPPQADEAAPSCPACRSSFGFFLRRHHCRLCGGVFCDSCSKARVPIPRYFKAGEGPQRVCERCRTSLAAGCTLAVKRYSDGAVYVGQWSQGRWAGRGLYRSPCGHTACVLSKPAGGAGGQCFTGGHHNSLSSSSAADGGSSAVTVYCSTSPSAAAAAAATPTQGANLHADLNIVEDMRTLLATRLPNASEADVEAFRVWWVRVVSGVREPYAYDFTPYKAIPPPTASLPFDINVFSEYTPNSRRGRDRAAAEARRQRFVPAVIPPMPPAPSHLRPMKPRRICEPSDDDVLTAIRADRLNFLRAAVGGDGEAAAAASNGEEEVMGGNNSSGGAADAMMGSVPRGYFSADPSPATVGDEDDGSLRRHSSAAQQPPLSADVAAADVSAEGGGGGGTIAAPTSADIVVTRPRINLPTPPIPNRDCDTTALNWPVWEPRPPPRYMGVASAPGGEVLAPRGGINDFYADGLGAAPVPFDDVPQRFRVCWDGRGSSSSGGRRAGGTGGGAYAPEVFQEDRPSDDMGPEELPPLPAGVVPATVNSDNSVAASAVVNGAQSSSAAASAAPSTDSGSHSSGASAHSLALASGGGGLEGARNSAVFCAAHDVAPRRQSLGFTDEAVTEARPDSPPAPAPAPPTEESTIEAAAVISCSAGDADEETAPLHMDAVADAVAIGGEDTAADKAAATDEKKKEEHAVDAEEANEEAMESTDDALMVPHASSAVLSVGGIHNTAEDEDAAAVGVREGGEVVPSSLREEVSAVAKPACEAPAAEPMPETEDADAAAAAEEDEENVPVAVPHPFDADADADASAVEAPLPTKVDEEEDMITSEEAGEGELRRESHSADEDEDEDGINPTSALTNESDDGAALMANIPPNAEEPSAALAADAADVHAADAMPPQADAATVAAADVEDYEEETTVIADASLATAESASTLPANVHVSAPAASEGIAAGSSDGASEPLGAAVTAVANVAVDEVVSVPVAEENTSLNESEAQAVIDVAVEPSALAVALPPQSDIEAMPIEATVTTEAMPANTILATAPEAHSYSDPEADVGFVADAATSSSSAVEEKKVPQEAVDDEEEEVRTEEVVALTIAAEAEANPEASARGEAAAEVEAESVVSSPLCDVQQSAPVASSTAEGCDEALLATEPQLSTAASAEAQPEHVDDTVSDNVSEEHVGGVDCVDDSTTVPVDVADESVEATATETVEVDAAVSSVAMHQPEPEPIVDADASAAPADTALITADAEAAEEASNDDAVADVAAAEPLPANEGDAHAESDIADDAEEAAEEAEEDDDEASAPVDASAVAPVAVVDANTAGAEEGKEYLPVAASPQLEEQQPAAEEEGVEETDPAVGTTAEDDLV